MENEIKRPDLCQFIDKDPIEIKKRLLEVPLIPAAVFRVIARRLILNTTMTLDKKPNPN